MKALIRPFIYIVSALMALSFASCNDFLDKEPEGKVPEEKVDYTNISNMYQPVSGVYAKIRTVVCTGGFGKLPPSVIKMYSVANGMAVTIII